MVKTTRTRKPKAAAEPASEHEGILSGVARTLGSTLGAISAKTKQASQTALDLVAAHAPEKAKKVSARKPVRRKKARRPAVRKSASKSKS